MKNLVTFSVEKAITVFMVVIAVAIFGVVSFTRLTTDLFPSINIPFAVVITPYPGATPEEVERDINIPFENVFQTTTNVQQVTTTSSENFSLVTLEFNQSADMDTAIIEMREGLNAIIDQLPDNAGYPNIIRLNPDLLPIMNFSVTFEGKSLEELTEWIETTMRPQIERVPGVATFDVSGGYESEIRITLDQDAIDQVNDQIAMAFEALPESPEFVLDKAYVNNILSAQNFAFPAGFVQIDGINYLVRVGDDLDSFDTIKNLVLIDFDIPFLALPKVRLNDIATVEFVSANAQQYAKVNGQDSITVSLQKGSGFATTEVTRAVNEALEILEADNADINITMLLDQGEFIDQSTGTVLNNLILGGILAILILFVFLRNVRVTFIVGIAIPISLMFAIILIYLSGITLNIVSLGGLALGIGMLVDNSIVVIENIFRLKKEGASNKEAAISGTSQVAGAITASTLTTIGVFAPIIFIEDFVREIFFQLALTIAFSLIASLIIALTFVPAIANRMIRVDKTKQSKMFEAIKSFYGRVLQGFMKVKLVVIFAVLVLFVLSILGSISRGFEFFPATDEGTLNATISIKDDQPFNFVDFTDDLDKIYDHLIRLDNIETVGITIGGGFGFFGGGGDGTSANVSIVLSADRDLTTTQMRDQVDTLLSDNFNHLESTVFGTESDAGFLVGSGIEVLLQGPDMDGLRTEALRIQSLLESIEGLRNIDPGFGRETTDIKVTVDKDVAITQGLTVGQVLGGVAQYLSGPEQVTTLSVDGRNIRVMLYEEDQTTRRSITDTTEIEMLVVGMNMFTGEPVILSDIATVELVPGFASIRRINGARSLSVTADVATGYNASLLANDIRDELSDHTLPSGYSLTLQGESEEIMSAISNLLLVGALGILIVFMIMASQFQSLTYPFIIMITIPLAFTGGLGLLYIFNMPVSVVAVLGLIILAGVIVNNGIVLVDYINQLRATGMDLDDAIVEAGKTRLRPIFMTAITTILALTGLAFGFGDGAELTQPLALTSIGGLIYATFLTIFVVPIMYHLVTTKGRTIFSVFISLVGGVAAVYFYDVGSLVIAIAITVTITVLVPIIVFFPKKPIEQTEVAEDTLDTIIKNIGNRHAS